MAYIIKNIARIIPGGVSMISAEKANELIDRINAITCGYIFPNVNVGTLNVSGSQFIIDLSQLDERLQAVESQSDSSSNNITSMQNNITILQNNVTTVENRLNNVTINGSGSCAGNNITITVNINI